jgi:hypothetical protein
MHNNKNAENAHSPTSTVSNEIMIQKLQAYTPPPPYTSLSELCPGDLHPTAPYTPGPQGKVLTELGHLGVAPGQSLVSKSQNVPTSTNKLRNGVLRPSVS